MAAEAACLHTPHTHASGVSSLRAGVSSGSSVHTQGPHLRGSKAARYGASEAASGVHSCLLVHPGPLRVTGVHAGETWGVGGRDLTSPGKVTAA